MAAAQVSSVLRRLRRVLVAVLLVLLLTGAAACPFAGRYLIIDEPLQPADVLVVLAGGTTARWLEAADLYREGFGRRLLLSPGYPDPVGDGLRRQGIRFPTESQVMKDVYTQVGVPAEAIEIMPVGYDNTADEAAGARQIALARGWRSLVVVTSPYHTRRTLYAFQREFAGSGIGVQVRASRHERPSPDRWWRSRSDIRWVVSETQRLIGYRLGLGR